MADRDVEIDVVARDKTSKGVQSAEKGFARLGKSAKAGVDQWGAGFKRLGKAADRWANSGDTAGKKFVRGIGKGLSKVAELGGIVGGGLSKGLTAAGPQVGIALTAVLVGAAITAAPAVAGAIVGGAGLGGVVGGLLIASKDARVASAFDKLKEEIGTDLQDAAKRFVPATLDAVKDARAAFKGMLPNLRQLFNVSATWLGPLTRSLGKAAQLALDGITKAVTKAGPIVAAIGDGVVMVGRAVGQVFAGLSDNGASMALALKFVFALVAGSIQQAGAALNLLVEAFEFFVKHIPGGQALLNSMTKSQDGAKTSAFNLAGGFQALAGDANGAAAGIANAKQKADEFANSNISLARAQIGSRDAARQASEAIKENSKAKISNKERADRNMTALLNMADAFNTEADAGDRSGISAGKASAAYVNNRAKLIAMAEKAGYSKTKAEELAAQLLKVPKNVNTDINVDTKTPLANVVTIKKAIGTIKGKTVYVTVKERTNSDGSIHVSGKGGSGTLTRRWGGIDYAMARGGALEAHFAKAPTVLFGERQTGGEAFIPRNGDRSRSRSIAETVVRDWLGGQVSWDGRGQAAAAGPMVLEAHIEIGGEVVRVVRTELREHNRGLRRRVGAGAGR